MEALRKAKNKKGSRASRRRNLIKDIQALQSKHLEAKIVTAKEEMALKHAIKMEKANLKELENKLLEKGGELAEKKVQLKTLTEEEEERRKQDIKPWQVEDRVQKTRLRLQERLIKDQVAKLGKDIISKKNQLSKLCNRLFTMMNQPSIGCINWTPMEMTFREPQIPTPSVFYPKQKVPGQDHDPSKETIKCQKQVARKLVEYEDSEDSNEENASYNNNVTVDMLLRLDEEVKAEEFSASLMKPNVGGIQHQKIAVKDALIAEQRGAGLAGCHNRGDLGGLDTIPTTQDDSELSEATPVQPFHQVTHSLQHLQINPFASIAPTQKKKAPVRHSYANIYRLPFQEIGTKKPSRGIDKNGEIQTPYDGVGNTGSGSVQGGNLTNVDEPVNDFRAQQSTLMQSHQLSNTVPVDYYNMPVSTNSTTQLLMYGSTNSNNNGNHSGGHFDRVCAGIADRNRVGATGHLYLSGDKNGANSVATANDSSEFAYGWPQGAVEKNDMFVEDLD